MRISSAEKETLIRCFQSGKTISEAARISSINKNTAKYILNQYIRNNGVLIEKKRGGKRHFKLNNVILNRIEEITKNEPNISLRCIRDKILQTECVKLSLSSVRNGLNRLRITLK